MLVGAVAMWSEEGRRKAPSKNYPGPAERCCSFEEERRHERACEDAWTGVSSIYRVRA